MDKEVHYNFVKADYLLAINLFLTLVLVGGVLNHEAQISNGSKMPVSGCSNTGGSTQHFCYSNKDEVNNWILTDFISIRNSYYSIGDFVIFIALFSSLITIITFNFKLNKIRKEYETR